MQASLIIATTLSVKLGIYLFIYFFFFEEEEDMNV